MIFRSTVPGLPNLTREALIANGNERVADGHVLYVVAKTAHWNVQGPSFAAVHPQLDALASLLADVTDTVAERVRALGGLITVSDRSATKSAIPDLPEGLTRDIELVRAVGDRIDVYAKGLRSFYLAAGAAGDIATANALQGALEQVEHTAWLLLQTTEPGVTGATAPAG